MLRKRIKKNTLKWKKIYAEQLLDMMDEEENALQKIYLTGYVLELKKNRYFAGWYKDRIVCRSLEYARYFPSAEAAEEYVHKYLGFAGMSCYVCHVNWTLASCGSENMEDNEENLLEENGKILSFTNYADVKQYQKQRGMELRHLLVGALLCADGLWKEETLVCQQFGNFVSRFLATFNLHDGKPLVEGQIRFALQHQLQGIGSSIRRHIPPHLLHVYPLHHIFTS